MAIFIMMFIVGVIALVANSATKVKKKPSCKLHSWVYDNKNFLYCKECLCRPGEAVINDRE